MSAIHEALKRSDRPSQVVVTVTKKSAAGWLWGLTLVLFLLMSAAVVRESAQRRHAEGKLQQAYLQLNGERGKSLDMIQDQKGTEARLALLQKKLDRVMAEKDSLARANKEVELDNVAKEKKISQMTKDLHVLEMTKLRLTEELRNLQSQPETKPQ